MISKKKILISLFALSSVISGAFADCSGCACSALTFANFSGTGLILTPHGAGINNPIWPPVIANGQTANVGIGGAIGQSGIIDVYSAASKHLIANIGYTFPNGPVCNGSLNVIYDPNVPHLMLPVTPYQAHYYSNSPTYLLFDNGTSTSVK